MERCQLKSILKLAEISILISLNISLKHHGTTTTLYYQSLLARYLSTGHPSLKHQRFEEKQKKDEWYNRGTFAAPAAKKFRKGACENCGAMTHKSRDCLDRPRKVGAKFTNKDIRPDELIQNVELGFEAKRDRWTGYDPNEYTSVTTEWDLVEEERRKLREKKANEKLTAAAKGLPVSSDSEDNDEEEDEDKYADDADMVGQKVDTKARTTVRNLRIREDTAKYLINLDANSAYYDPKTRSMRQNPEEKKDINEVTYAGDNFVRYTGDVPEMAKVQLFAWEAAEAGKDISLQANPSAAEKMYKQYQEKKKEISSTVKNTILEKYGGEEHLQAPPKELLLAQTETYVEYSQTGRVIKGPEPAKVRSKYEEDVYPLNHTSVWGSYWTDGKWGYACCHQVTRNAYCTGEEGKEAMKASANLLEDNMNRVNEEEEEKSLVEAHLDRLKKRKDDQEPGGPLKKGRLGEGDISIDHKKLKSAIDEEKDRLRKLERGEAKYNTIHDAEMTEEQLEAYRLLRNRTEDPMANYIDDDDK